MVSGDVPHLLSLFSLYFLEGIENLKKKTEGNNQRAQYSTKVSTEHN